MPLDHIGFAVADFPGSRAFYVAASAPLGIGTSSGPGGRAQHGSPDHAAFVIDLHGHTIEAVCHAASP